METHARTKVINGALYARSSAPFAYELRVHDLGGGHIEASALPRYSYEEVGHLDPAALADWEAFGPDFFGRCKQSQEPSEQEKLDKLARNRERSSRRAKGQVRRLVKVKGLRVMLTLTYRENMTDRARMARDFDVFMKRVRRVVPDFEYVCVFERQKRGAWHAHIACRQIARTYERSGVQVKSYDLLRSMWRGVVGQENGNVDVSRNRKLRQSSAKLAAYLSKYIGKYLGADLDRFANSYSASSGGLPPPVVERVLTSDIGLAMNALLDLVSVEVESECQFHHALLDCGGWFVSLSPPERWR